MGERKKENKRWRYVDDEEMERWRDKETERQ